MTQYVESFNFEFMLENVSLEDASSLNFLKACVYVYIHMCAHMLVCVPVCVPEYVYMNVPLCVCVHLPIVYACVYVYVPV